MSEEKRELVETKRVNQKIDVSKALMLRLKGLSFEEIAGVLGCSRQGVHHALTNFETFVKEIHSGDLDAYVEERKTLLGAAELKLLRAVLDDEAIEKAPLAARVMAFGTVLDKRRLEEGKSTENLGILGKLIISSEDELGKSTKQNAVKTDSELETGEDKKK
jgi:hypothetical protein